MLTLKQSVANYRVADARVRVYRADQSLVALDEDNYVVAVEEIGDGTMEQVLEHLFERAVAVLGRPSAVAVLGRPSVGKVLGR